MSYTATHKNSDTLNSIHEN